MLFIIEKYFSKIRPFYNIDMIKVITGIRRYGKSYIMRLIKEEIEKTGVPEKDLVFLDLDKKGNKKY